MKSPSRPVPLQKKKTPHPRRPPAHQSVSLRHSPPATGQPSGAPQPRSLEFPNATASDKANPPSSVSPKTRYNKQSSGESSDAGKWFESSNNNALQSNASFPDNDPPFFLRNSSSGDTPPDVPRSHDQKYQQQMSIAYRPGLARLGTNDSSTEDFRDVIDDLTIANMKLKLKLRKYEKLYDNHLQDEKLFEVRFHGLPHHKKKQLEDTLRKFAASLGENPSSEEPSNPTILHQPAPFNSHKTATSYASRFAESGYASISASGQNSTSAPSYQASNQAFSRDTDRRRVTKSQYNRQQQNIQSYLHDIPAGLLPKIHAPMTEKSRKRLVVRRLEQIFAGKRSAPGNHPQEMQQEEVSRSAAQADRQTKEATGQRSRPEGHREARIMPVLADDEEIPGQNNSEAIQKVRPNLSISEQDFAGSGSPDQRPTRPLDLDPFRAQVPAENMNYIRHLGFTPPDMDTGDAPQFGHGWLHLNLLINMAQLHTYNVTLDFVKDAVAEYSSKFELSHDGRKIRWKGGLDASRMSSGSSSEHLSSDSPLYSAIGHSKSPLKDSKTGQSGSGESCLDSERRAKRIARTQKQKEQDKLSYTPIFFHKEDLEDYDDYPGYEMGSSSASLLQSRRPGDSHGLGSSAMRSSSSRKRRDNGPMIFYNKAKFCTDLSGDRRGLSKHNYEHSNSITTHPLGITYASHTCEEPYITGLGEPRGPFDTTPTDFDAKEGSRITFSDDMEFSPAALKNDNGTDSSDAMDFEASGLGGVQPEDNFSIRVRRSQVQTASFTRPSAHRKSRLYPNNISEALGEGVSHKHEGLSAKHPIVKEEILSAFRKSLPSSTLPPASFFPFDSTSSGDVDSDLESDVSSNPSSTSSEAENAPTIPQRMPDMSPVGTGNEDESSDYEQLCDEDDEDDDESIDLLATARRMDPKTIRESEREYDAAIADRLAEIIPAGNSAATAGGGSGFCSPENMTDGDMKSEKKSGRSTTSGSISSRPRGLKRTRTRELSATDMQGSKGPKSQKT